MRDSYGRDIHYLRVSLTDRCNFRCVYCMPEHGVIFHPHEHHLSDAELTRLIGLAATLGIDRIRLTGGEPTVRPNLVSIVQAISAVPGIKEIAMTTNALRLEKIAEPLARAGMQRVNISIDTLDAERFTRITRIGKLDAVWRGILAAERAGLTPIKLNSVIVRGFNEQDIVDLARLTIDYAWELRFIEMMPLGSISTFQSDSIVTAQEIQARVQDAFGELIPLAWNEHDPARPYQIRGGRGVLGFISSVSAPFCAGCDRVRLTSDGRLRLCLLRDDEVDLLTPLREGASDATLTDLIARGIYRKPWGHGLAENIIPTSRIMSQIGG